MTLQMLVAGIVVAALIVYALTGGADFGGGVWDLVATGARARAQREVIARAVAPIWEANHVWLIFVIVVLFVCFPEVYSTIGTALHIPLVVMLFGVVLRGSAFAFRSHDYGPTQGRWDLVFAIASVVTPITLGMCVGAIASGTIHVSDGVVDTDFVTPWAAPFPVAVGLFALAEFAFLGATYLTLEVGAGALRADFQLRALASGAVAGGLGAVALWLAGSGAPVVHDGLLSQPIVLVAAPATLLGAMIALGTGQFHVARVLGAGHVALVILGWALAQFPWMIVPDLTIDNACADPRVLRASLAVLAVGSAVLFPSFAWLYLIFKNPLSER